MQPPTDISDIEATKAAQPKLQSFRTEFKVGLQLMVIFIIDYLQIIF